ncbi:MAG: class I SAM-dependent methyltransferase [Proteobacteria bacterium]|nr:class I SAM-dependent methyltransferase [Pseudomonadota bacterium]
MTVIKTNPATCNVCGDNGGDVVSTLTDLEYDTCSNEFDIIRCGQCGHHYLSPLPDPSELMTIYPPHYLQYNIDGGDGGDKLAYRVKDRLDSAEVRNLTKEIGEGGAVLDVGCAQGRFLDLVRQACPGVKTLDGIEISEKAGNIAKEKGFNVFIGLLPDFPGQADTYDLVAMQEVIEHLYDPSGCVKKIAQLLKPGGRVYITTPTVECMEFRLFGKKYWGNYHCPRHFNLFTPKGLSEILTRHGFVIESISHKLQPAGWIVTFENMLKVKKAPRWLVKFVNRENPVLLALFTIIDMISLATIKKTSDMKVIAVKTT